MWHLRQSFVVIRRLVCVGAIATRAGVPEGLLGFVVEPASASIVSGGRAVVRDGDELHDGIHLLPTIAFEGVHLLVVQSGDSNRQVVHGEQIGRLEVIVLPEKHHAPGNPIHRRQRLVHIRSAAPFTRNVVESERGELVGAERRAVVVERRNAFNEFPSSLPKQEVEEVAVEGAVILTGHELGQSVGDQLVPPNLPCDILEEALLALVDLPLTGEVHAADLVPVELLMQKIGLAVRHLEIGGERHALGFPVRKLRQQLVSRLAHHSVVMRVGDLSGPHVFHALRPVDLKSGRDLALVADVDGVEAPDVPTSEFPHRVFRAGARLFQSRGVVSQHESRAANNHCSRTECSGKQKTTINSQGTHIRTPSIESCGCEWCCVDYRVNTVFVKYLTVCK
ncbi:MAG: hypothetical protein JWN64_591 [Parcubacteria group bacterium]|nr:hypothetical protein [Parcubacteria group bacterium]